MMRIQRHGAWFACLAAFLLLVDQTVVAQEADSPTILIKNARLIDRQGTAEDVLVNILIKKGELFIVTEDDIAADKADLAVDAEEGFLIFRIQISISRAIPGLTRSRAAIASSGNPPGVSVVPVTASQRPSV